MYRYLWRHTMPPPISLNRIVMKCVIPCFFVLLLLLGCSNADKLTFKTIQIKEQVCADCPKIKILIPEATASSKVSQSVNTALKEECISLLNFDDEIELNEIEDAISSFSNGYKEMKKLFADELGSWEAEINGKVVFEDPDLLTIELNSYVFTGGAHGYTSKRFLNFDKAKGTELENWELFNSAEKFEEFAEAKFREQESIPENESINHTGLMFERDSFYLPENIGFTKDGVQLLYNPYEVASYADGPIELILTHNEVKKYLAKKPKS